MVSQRQKVAGCYLHGPNKMIKSRCNVVSRKNMEFWHMKSIMFRISRKIAGSSIFCPPVFAMSALLLVPAPASAMDAFMLAGQQAVQFSFDTMRNVTATNAMNAAVRPRQGRNGANEGRMAAVADGRARTLAPMAPANATAVARPLTYQPSAALERETARAFIARLEGKDPAGARAIAPLLERHGYAGEFRRFIRGTPLSERDAADAVAMFVVMGFLIANNDMRDMPADHWGAVRDQFRASLGAQPELADPAKRAALGEEMKLLTTILYGGFDGSKKSGQSAQYAKGVAAMFAQQGLDLRTMRLDQRGLSRK